MRGPTKQRFQDLAFAVRLRRGVLFFAVLALLLTGCGDLERPRTEPYYAQPAAPRRQEFRWSNGKMPKSFDPALAVAPPETDIVRAIYEGLTELDPQSLQALPAAAERWTASEDFRTWTFHLRSSARWSDGKPVTADDFVRAWKRVGEIGKASGHRSLLANIVGFEVEKPAAGAPASDLIPNTSIAEALQSPFPESQTDLSDPAANSNTKTVNGPAPVQFGAAAVDPLTLRVLLIAPDRDFPKLAAHPIFRPISSAATPLKAQLDKDVVTNGAFRISSVDADSVAIARSQTYWNREEVKLESARFVAARSAEDVLAAYRAGEIDAITNVEFAPLALKLLEPFEDFRRRTHAALNFYEVNHEKAPFNDRRVREALAVSIERERLTEGQTEGQTSPALGFLPFSSKVAAQLAQDQERAKDLLEEAGFPNGEGFPVIRLVVNRNETQHRIARAVARMWKQNLNLESEILVKDLAELEATRTSGDYDLIRRNVVYPSANELMSMLAVLKPAATPESRAGVDSVTSGAVEVRPATSPSAEEASQPNDPGAGSEVTEENAVYELWAIPLYYPTSYSLVKPYVTGFELNSLDAPLLTKVAIDSDWQPK